MYAEFARSLLKLFKGEVIATPAPQTPASATKKAFVSLPKWWPLGKQQAQVKKQKEIDIAIKRIKQAHHKELTTLDFSDLSLITRLPPIPPCVQRLTLARDGKIEKITLRENFSLIMSAWKQDAACAHEKEERDAVAKLIRRAYDQNSTTLTICGFPKLRDLPTLLFPLLEHVTTLTLEDCPSLTTLAGGIPGHLKNLKIRNCPNLAVLPNLMSSNVCTSGLLACSALDLNSRQENFELILLEWVYAAPEENRHAAAAEILRAYQQKLTTLHLNHTALLTCLPEPLLELLNTVTTLSIKGCRSLHLTLLPPQVTELIVDARTAPQAQLPNIRLVNRENAA